ncbi:MAG: ABC transporter permease [Cyclobacteriaceae bacterium]
MKHSPPGWADKFLEWYCNPDILEEVQGDVYELYEKRLKEEGVDRARKKFIWDVVRFFRWSNIKRSPKNSNSNSFTMLTSYFKLGFRNALRNRLTSSINLFGLALAIGVAITIFTFVDYFFNMDSFHVNQDRVYQITNMVKNTGDANNDNWSDSPLLLAPSLAADHAAVEAYCRVEFQSGSMRYNETVFDESIWFVDPDFSRMFSFPLLYGNPNALNDPKQIVITQPISEKYFGNTNPVGESFSIKFGNGTKEDFTVGAVFEDLPGNSSIRFDNLLSMQAFENLDLKDAEDWSYFTDATFIMIKEGNSITEVSSQMEQYKEIQNKANVEWPIQSFRFYALNGLSRNNNEIYQEIAQGAHPAGMITLSIISLMLLLLACFNYMNIAVATVTTRLKEIGIRKVIGGRRKEIIAQFLAENLVLCSAALILGLLLAHLFFMPGLSSLFPITVSLASANVLNLVIFFVILLLFIGLVSGSYPALYISSFQPVNILRGKEKFGQKSLFSKSLLTIQFVLAFTTIIACFVFIANSLNLQSKDWGYDHDQNYVVPVNNYESYIGMRDGISQNKEIVSFSGSVQSIGQGASRVSIDYENEKHPVMLFEVGFNYLETMNLRLKEGRFFDESIQSDKSESVVINTLFAEAMGWEDPIGKSFEYDSARRYVVGVVEKFHYYDFYATVDPVMFTIAPEENFKYLAMKVRAGSMLATETKLKELWKDVAPDDPYTGYFQDEVFAGFHRDNTSNVTLLAFISVVTILLSCMGLFGLVSYNITRRMKEFSVRKVFGASINHIFKLMNRDYLWMIILSFSIGAPLGFFSISSLIAIIYPDPIPTSVTPFLVGVIIMIITVGVTVASQIGRIVRNNPAQTLRNE